MRIDLYDGKYTYVCNDDGSDQHVQRYGERWRDLTGDGFVLAMAQKIEKQQERIAELEKEVNEHEMAYEVILKMLNRCLPYMQKHDADLTSDIGIILGFTEPSELLEQRDLEQQAKGAEDIIESVLGEPESLTSDALSIRYEFLDRAKQLHEQAKGGNS